MRKHCCWGYSENHLARKRALDSRGAFAVLDPRNVCCALESHQRGEFLLRQAPDAPMGAQVTQHCSFCMCHRLFVPLSLNVQRNHFILTFRAVGNSVENMPAKSYRVDMGTRRRNYWCRKDANHGDTTRDKAKGIDLSMPYTFIPSSTRLPSGTGAPLTAADIIRFLCNSRSRDGFGVSVSRNRMPCQHVSTSFCTAQ